MFQDTKPLGTREEASGYYDTLLQKNTFIDSMPLSIACKERAAKKPCAIPNQTL